MKNIRIRNFIIAAMFTALTAVGAFIKIPIPPYPVALTLQTAFVYLCALLLPKREAFMAQAAYVLLGLIGIPIFTAGGGIFYVLQPTFGYLPAFVLCAPLLSAYAHKTLFQKRLVLFLIGGIGIVCLTQIIGLAYMAAISAFYLHTPLPFSRLLYLLLIFLPLDIIKLIFATAFAMLLHKRVPALIYF